MWLTPTHLGNTSSSQWSGWNKTSNLWKITLSVKQHWNKYSCPLQRHNLQIHDHLTAPVNSSSIIKLPQELSVSLANTSLDILTAKYRFCTYFIYWQLLVFRCIHKIAKSDYYLHHVCLSVHLTAWNNSVPTGHIFVKFDVYVFFKIQLLLKSYKKNRYFTWRPKYSYDIMPNSS